MSEQRSTAMIEAEMRDLTQWWPPAPWSQGVGIPRAGYRRYLELVEEHREATRVEALELARLL